MEEPTATEKVRGRKSKKQMFFREFVGPTRELVWEATHRFLKQHGFPQELTEMKKGDGRKSRLFLAKNLSAENLLVSESEPELSDGTIIWKVRVFYASEKSLPFLTKAN